LGGLLIYLFARRFAVNIFNIPNSLHATAIACFSLAGIGFFVNFILVIFSKIPEALQRFDVTSLNYVIIGSCTTFGSVLMIFLGFGVETLIVINAMGSLFALWLFYKAVKNLLPSLHVNMKFDYPMTRSLLKFGFFTIATRASGVLAESINQFFIGSIIGPTGVAIFGVPFKMVGRLSAGIQRIAFIIFPLSSQLHANNDIEKLQEVYSRVSRYIFIMASSIMIPAIAYAEPLLFYWIGKDFSGQGTHVFIMVSLGFLLISTTMVPGLFAMGMGKPEYNAFFSILTAFLNAAFIYPLTNEWGVNGASNAFFLSTLQAPFAVYVVTTKVVKVDWRIYISHVYVKGILLDLAFFVFYKFILINFIVGFFSFIFLFLVSILLMVYAGYWMGVERDDKKVIQGALRNLRNLLSSTE
jgi:O-antigen/teichoic acid export membrane protein